VYALLLSGALWPVNTETHICRYGFGFATKALLWAIMGAVVWFVGIQMFVLKAVCAYCVADHVAGLLGAALLWWALRNQPAGVSNQRGTWIRVRANLGALAVGACGVGILIAGQIMFQPTVAVATKSAQVLDTGVGDHREKTFFGRFVLPVDDLPLLGAKDAEHILVVLLDYSCGHCREMDRQLAKARQLYGARVAVMVLPIPLDRGCNPYIPTSRPGSCEYAQIALALRHRDNESFVKFHEWLLSSPATAESAYAYARNLVGTDVLEQQLAHPWVTRQLTQIIELHQAADAGAVPMLFVGQNQINGLLANEAALLAVLEEQLRLTPRGWDFLATH
jgi:protein-disulfide isomerase